MEEPTASIIESYTPDHFIEWPAWIEAERFLSGNGTCCGVGGPRGAGKSWLLRHAVTWSKTHKGIGVYFPSPSAYDASAFLAGLCQALAVQVEISFKPRDRPVDRLTSLFRSRAIQVGTILYLAGSVAYLLRGRLPSFSSAWPILFIGLGLVSLYFSVYLRRYDRKLSRDPHYRLYKRAVALQRWILYASATRTVNELAIEAGKGLIAKGKTSEELALSERSVTELALVSEFRRLAEEVAESGTTLVIVIDELDKIGAVDDVRRLLRSVKGVLDPSGVVLFVSVSDEAVTHLGLGGVRGRDEISSSFSATFHIGPLTSERCRTLVHKATGLALPKVSDAISVLSAGNPREAVRILDAHIRGTASDPTVDADNPFSCIATSHEIELQEFLTALVTDPEIGEEQRVAAYIWAKEQLASPTLDADQFGSRLLEGWQPPWAIDRRGRVSPTSWPPRVSEEWRRLLMRSVVRAQLCLAFDGKWPVAPEKFDSSAIEQLRLLMEVSGRAAGVGKHLAEVEVGIL